VLSGLYIENRISNHSSIRPEPIIGTQGRESHTLVDIGLSVMDLLVLLVEESVLGSGGTSGNVGVVVLGDFLVDLLGGGGSGALDGLGDVVDGVLDGLAVSMEEME
jgi:hypothetical protein